AVRRRPEAMEKTHIRKNALSGNSGVPDRWARVTASTSACDRAQGRVNCGRGQGVGFSGRADFGSAQSGAAGDGPLFEFGGCVEFSSFRVERKRILLVASKAKQSRALYSHADCRDASLLAMTI